MTIQGWPEEGAPGAAIWVEEGGGDDWGVVGEYFSYLHRQLAPRFSL